MTGATSGSNARPARVHIPAGFLAYAGDRVKAACACGWSTRPLSTQQRAWEALMSQHGFTEPICKLCGRDRYAALRLASQTWDDVQIVTDPQTGDQFLACANDVTECHRLAVQRQLHLDRAAFDSLGIPLDTRLWIIPGGKK